MSGRGSGRGSGMAHALASAQPHQQVQMTETRTQSMIVSPISGSPVQTASVPVDVVTDARLTDVETKASDSAQFNRMTYAQMEAFHARQQAMMAEQQQLVDFINRNKADQEARELHLQQQQQLLIQQQTAVTNQVAENQRLALEHQQVLQAARAAIGDHDQKLEHLAHKARRDSERWGLFAQAVPTGGGGGGGSGGGGDSTNAAPRSATPMMGAQQVPEAPMFAGSTKRERREFMDQYLAYSRRVTVLNQGLGGAIFLMPLAACIDQRVVPRVAHHDFGKSFEEITEVEWRDWFLAAREVAEVDVDSVTRALTGLKMDVRLKDAESRVGRLLADFYQKLETNDASHFAYAEPKLAVKCLVAAVRPGVVRSTVEKQLLKESHKHLSKDVRAFTAWLQDVVHQYMPYEAQADADAKKLELATKAGGGGGGRGGGRGGKPLTAAAPALPRVAAVPPAAEKRRCLKCNSEDHGVYKCKKIKDVEEAKRLVKEFFAKKDRAKVGAVVAPDGSSTAKPGGVSGAVVVAAVPQGNGRENSRTVACEIDGECGRAMLDSGSDPTLLCPLFLDKLVAAGKVSAADPLAEAVVPLGGFCEGMSVAVNRRVSLSVHFETGLGKLILRNVICWVASAPLQSGLGDLLVSRLVMARLGYSPTSLLDDARSRQAEYDVGGEDGLESPLVAVVRRAEDVARDAQRGALSMAPEEENLLESEEQVCFPELKGSKEEDRAAVWTVLTSKVTDARDAGCSTEYAKDLLSLLEQYQDVFRLVLGRDPPVDVAPLNVTLKPAATPVRAKARRYSVEQRAFMDSHVRQLVEAGLVYRNPRAKWCSPPLIVKKPGGSDFRMTVDVRAVNAQTERIVWPMPLLEVVLGYLAGAHCFFSLDFFKGYWQFLLSKESQEIFSFLTDLGVWTPTRVLMGGTDSVAFCQSAVQEMFEDQLYKSVLIWLDDILGYAKTPQELLAELTRTLAICQRRGLKLNPKKCSFFAVAVKWCGRIVSGEGVKHDPERIKVLQAIQPPQDGQALQQFVCAMNWMRMSLPAYNVLTKPLTDLMELVYKQAGGRTKQKVGRVPLVDVGWGPAHLNCLEACKAALGKAVTLAHPDPTKLVCVFADASDLHWGGVVTQIPYEHADRDLAEQHHEPLMFLSGTFSGAAQRWAIVEKEAFSIVECLRRADYLLHKPSGFALFTDHANLKFIFNPGSINAAIPKYTAAKLDRWALLIMGYRYDIHDIAGEDNVWADLLSRWGHNMARVCAIMHVPLRISPLRDEQFGWPSMAEIVEAQEGVLQSAPWREAQLSLVKRQPKDEAGLAGMAWRVPNDQVWVPHEASELQMRLCVVAHFGLGGHRGRNATIAAIRERFWWKGLADVGFFIGRCLHCASCGPSINRPFGTAPHATKPNELLHWDFLYMEDGYLLVVKDDAAKFCWLWETDVATAQVVAACLMQWFAVFGICVEWMSDQGSHFKNEVIRELQHTLGAQHHFSAARCPWSNGTAESAMKPTLHAFRALLSEWRMDTKQWRRIVLPVMLILNQAPTALLNGKSPVTLMTGARAMSPLDAIAIPGPRKTTTLDQVWQACQKELVALQRALHQWHEEAAEASAKKRAKGRKNHADKAGVHWMQFEAGDFVLAWDAEARSGSKLKGKWKGPFQVTRVLHDWLLEIMNLVTGDVREAHAGRTKMYSDDHLNVDEELLLHIAHNDKGHVVNKFLDARFIAQAQRHEVLVQWRGLSEYENSWEPATVMLEDVPVALQKFVREVAPNKPTVLALAKALKLPLKGKGGIVAGALGLQELAVDSSANNS